MATTPILGITQVTASQNTKEVTINDAIIALEAATNAKLEISYAAATTLLLSNTQATRNFIFVATGGTANSILRFPNTVNGNALNRVFAVRNESGYQLTVKFDSGAGSTVIIPNGATRLIDAMDGTDMIVAAEPSTAVNFLDLADVPASYTGQAGKFLTANLAEDALVFADAAQFPDFTDNAGKYLVVSSGEDGVEWVDLSLVVAFTGLTDTPANYTGAGGKLVAVNSGATGLEFIDMPDVEAVEYASAQRWRVRIDVPNVEDQVAFGEIEFLDVDGFNLCSTVGGTASASSEEVGREAEFAFDEDTTAGNGWFSELAFVTEEWVEFEFDALVQPRQVRLWPVTGFPDFTPLQFAFERYDGTDWVEAGLRTPDTWVSEEPQTFKINGVPFSSVVDAPIDGTAYVRKDGDWAPLVDGLPDLTGNEGKLLSVATGETDIEWVDTPQSLPPGGSTGQALLKQSGADGDADWQDIPSGGGGGNWWFTPPAAASSALASGDGTNPILTDDADAGLLFDFGAFTSGDDNRFAYRTLTNPSLDWTLTIAFNALLLDTAIGFGIGMRNTANSRAITFLARDSGWRMYNWTTLTSFNSLASGNFNPGGMCSRAPLWLRVVKSSGTFYYQVSSDGKQWAQVGTSTVAAYMSNNPDQVGLIGNYATTSYRGYAAVEYFDLTGPAV